VRRYRNLKGTSLVLGALIDTLFDPMVTLQLRVDGKTRASRKHQSDITANENEMRNYREIERKGIVSIYLKNYNC
jgi:hypothetical protein